MKKLLTVLVLLGVTMTAVPATAYAELLCVKSQLSVKKNKVNLGSALRTTNATRCPKNYRLVKDLAPVNMSPVISFARTDGSGTMLNFGGNGTTSVRVQRFNTGDTSFRFTITGSFPELSATDTPANQNRLTVFSSAETNDYGATNAYVNSASASEIVVTVYIWKSSDLSAGYQNGVSIGVFLGQSAQ